MSIAGSSGGRGVSRGCRVVSSLAYGWRGICVERAWRCVVTAGPAAGYRSGPWGASHASHKGAAEGTGDFVHRGRVCRLGLRLSVDGGQQLLIQRQRLDLVDPEDWAQVGRSGGLCRPFALGEGFQLLPAATVEPPCH